MAAESTPGMSVVFVSTEVAPWSKTGGLGDVVGSLPPALAARGHRVMTVSPRYDQYKGARDCVLGGKRGGAWIADGCCLPPPSQRGEFRLIDAL